MYKSITFEIISTTPYIINDGKTCTFTPNGRNIRGALGYIALNMGANVAEIFPDIKNKEVIFFDTTGHNTNYDISNGYKNQHLEGLIGNIFNCEIITTNKWLEDLKQIINFSKNNYLKIGKKTTQGYGLFQVFNVKIANKKAIKNEAVLITPGICSDGVVEVSFSKKNIEKNTFEIIKEKALKEGTIVSNHNGYFFGEYPSLGYGQLRSK